MEEVVQLLVEYPESQIQMVEVRLPADGEIQSLVLETIGPAGPTGKGLKGDRGIQGEKGDQGDVSDFFGVGHSSVTLNRTLGSVTSLTYSNGTIVTINRTGDKVTSLTSNTGKTKTIIRDVDGNVTGVTLS